MAGAPSRPLIGLTTYRQPVSWGAWERDAAFVPGTYLDVVDRAGGQPVLLPPLHDTPTTLGTDDGSAGVPAAGPEILYGLLDGVVLVGGGDVVPGRYDQAPDPATAGTSDDRDRLELDLLERALADGLPVLAVCRGLQILNVALGGDLVQHLPRLTGSEAHQPEPGAFAPVVVHTERGSHVHRLCGERVEVRCSHHQAVDRLGRGLRVTARSEDGVIEAAELDGQAFVVGVQWHPEEPGDVRLFEGLVTAARQHRGGDGPITGTAMA